MNCRVIAVAYPGFLLGCTAVYFLVERGVAREISPLMLSGLRLLLAGIVLVVVARCIGVEFKSVPKKLWRYSVVGFFTMALPHALLFVGMQSVAVNENVAAFIEGTIPGIVLIYLVAGNRRLEWHSSLLVCTALLSLALFLDINPFSRGFVDDPATLLVLISAAVTGLGIILSDRLLPSGVGSFGDKLRVSITNAAYSTLAAGLLTLGYVAVFTDEMSMVSGDAWGYIVALALFGTCLSWITFFMLLGEDIVLACSALVAIPVVTALVSVFGFGSILSLKEIVSAGLVILSLSSIIYLKLAKSRSVRGERKLQRSPENLLTEKVA